MSDVEDRLRDALRDLAPTDLPVEGLALGAWRRHARGRRRRLAVAGAAAVALLAGTAAFVVELDRAPVDLPSGPVVTPGDCTSIPQPASGDGPTWDAVSAPLMRAAWICPDPTGSPGGDGWELPLAPLTGIHAKSAMLPIWPRTSPSTADEAQAAEAACESVQSGPAFTLTHLTEDGRATTYRGSDEMCGGVELLRTFLVALADQDADALAASTPESELSCRSELSWDNGTEGPLLDFPLLAARLCLAPNYNLATARWTTYLQPMSYRPYRSTLLPPDTLALLNRDSTTVGYYRGNGECLGEGAWTYSIVGLTRSGQYRMLRTSCLDEMFVVGGEHTGFDVSPDTSAKLRALVPPS